MPAVAVPRGAAQGRGGVAANPDRRMRLLHGKGFSANVGIAVIFACEAGGRLGPELFENANPFIGHGAALVEVGAVQRLELLFQPADAHAQRDASAGQHIERCDHLRGQHRIAVRQHQHGRNQTQPFCRTRHHAKNGKRLQRVATAGMSVVESVGIGRLALDRKHDMVCDHREVQAKALAFARQGEHTLARGSGTAGREIEAEAHRAALFRHHHPQLLLRRLGRQTFDRPGRSAIDTHQRDPIELTIEIRLENIARRQM